VGEREPNDDYMKQRGNLSITTLILETVAKHEPNGVSKTKIMQYVMLNYKRVNKYCVQLMDANSLYYDLENHNFDISGKGRIALRQCDELATHIAPINELMNKYRIGDAYYLPLESNVMR